MMVLLQAVSYRATTNRAPAMQRKGAHNHLNQNNMNSKNKHIVFLTGAGMSAESGIKTFRGNDGLCMMDGLPTPIWWTNSITKGANNYSAHSLIKAICLSPNWKNNVKCRLLHKMLMIYTNALARRLWYICMANCLKCARRPTLIIRDIFAN